MSGMDDASGEVEDGSDDDGSNGVFAEVESICNVNVEGAGDGV